MHGRIERHPFCLGSRRKQRAYLNTVYLGFIRLGKPMDDAMMEAFKTGIRAEWLNERWLLPFGDPWGENR